MTVQAPELRRAVAAALSIAASQGLAADDAIVLQSSNKLTLRVLPCDVLARVAPAAHGAAQFEIDLAQRLAGYDSPVAALDPRVEPLVYRRDGFDVTLWTYYEPIASEVTPADYGSALRRLHAGMRQVTLSAPHFTDRIEEAEQLIAHPDQTPGLAAVDRDLLGDTLRRLRRAVGSGGAAEQLLHGEPHPGNLLSTKAGPVFIDLETCCRGPIEFDLAHAPEAVRHHYPAVDDDLLRQCRTLVLAMVTTWRWDRTDDFPNGRQLGMAGVSQLRSELDRDDQHRRG